MADNVTMKDIRALKYCMSGIRIFCRQNRISMDRVISEGIPIAELREKKIDNAMLEELIKHAESRVD